MDSKEQELRQEIRRLIRQKMAEGEINEVNLFGWVADKVSKFVTNHFNNVADYQYAALINDPKFKTLHKQFNMSEKDFKQKALALIKKDPKKFKNMLAYDWSKSRYAKFF